MAQEAAENYPIWRAGRGQAGHGLALLAGPTSWPPSGVAGQPDSHGPLMAGADDEVGVEVGAEPRADAPSGSPTRADPG